jgi:hypothetical protein
MSSKAPEMKLGGNFQAIKLGTHQSVAYTGTAGTISNVITSGVSIVRVICTTAAYIKIGASPTAAATDVYVAANTPEYFMCKDDGTEKVSAIQVSAGGTLHVTEGAV